MHRVMKWVSIVLLIVVGVLLLSALGLYLNTEMRLNKIYDLPPETVSVPTDAASLAQGKHLYTVHCEDCHGPDLAGDVIFNDPKLAIIGALNISGGRGEEGQALSTSDLVRAIRHGVSPDNKPLFIMPSSSFYYFNDQDLGALIAYLQSTPAVEKQLPKTSITPLGKILISAGAFGEVITAEAIDHRAPRPAVVQAGVTVEYGDYLVRTGECRTCHGENLTGGKDPNPEAPPAPNLTRSGELLGWSEADFIATMRTGTTPGGHELSDFMPWKFFGQMTDDELKAVWLYLRSLPVESASQ